MTIWPERQGYGSLFLFGGEQCISYCNVSEGLVVEVLSLLSLAFAPMLSSPFGEGRILIDGRLNQSKSTTKSRPLLDLFLTPSVPHDGAEGEEASFPYC